MNKTFKTLLITFLLFITSLSLISYSFEDIHVYQDSNYTDTIPKHFRKSSHVSSLGDTSINTTGLDELNISGSSQFTEYNLPLLIKAIDTDNAIINFDLREESHGFINGIAVSFHSEGVDINSTLTIQEIISAEFNHLKNIKLNEPLLFFNTNQSITPKSVNNEKVLVESNKLTYVRLPVHDGGLPKDDIVDYFVNFVNTQPKDSWLHFHCKAGVGRTTLFMIMYDIMKNSDNVSLHDIIARQVLLSKISETEAISFYTGKHYDFLSNFYDRIKNNKL